MSQPQEVTPPASALLPAMRSLFDVAYDRRLLAAALGLSLLSLLYHRYHAPARPGRSRTRGTPFSLPRFLSPRRAVPTHDIAVGGKKKSGPALEKSSLPATDPISPFPDLTRSGLELEDEGRQQLARDKELYWKLHNLEDHADVIEQARRRLRDLLDQTVSQAHTDPSSILALASYDSSAFLAFLAASHKSSTSRYEAYLLRRKAGGPREMFPTREYAIQWLKLSAVVKYVDGAWIGAIVDVAHRPTQGSSADRELEHKAGKMAWQVISEEFGDGDLAKNHVYLYEKLLTELKVNMTPDGWTTQGCERGFDGLPEGQGSARCWAAAVAQQAIGLLSSPGDYFSEALGFNLSYEALPYHLLVTTRELSELKIDNTYFALHVSIDNSDSGHSALARMAVEEYLAGVRERDGREAMDRAWRRIQAGYILAEGLPTTPSGPIEFEPVTRSLWQPKITVSAPPQLTRFEKPVVGIFLRKAVAASKLHCPSRMQISGQTIEEWLDPLTLTSDRALQFLRGLADKKPWVVPGDAEKSLFVKEMLWGGRMFGAFSRAEVESVRIWINTLGNVDVRVAYEAFIGQAPHSSVDSALPSTRFERHVADLWAVSTTDPLVSIGSVSLDISSAPTPTVTRDNLRRLIPLWFVSASLFEMWPLSPSRLATPLGMTALRLLRAQLGFAALDAADDICVGTDDVPDFAGRSEYLVGLRELGNRICVTLGVERSPDWQHLARSSDAEVGEVCAALLELRARPYSAAPMSLGAMSALVRLLHGSEAAASCLVSESDVETLRRIVVEQEAAIAECVVDKMGQWRRDYLRGYQWVAHALDRLVAR